MSLIRSHHSNFLTQINYQSHKLFSVVIEVVDTTEHHRRWHHLRCTATVNLQ